MRIFGRMVLAGVALAVAALTNTGAQAKLPPLVSPDELSAMQSDAGVVILDIRPDGYAQGHVPGAVAAPYGKWRGPADNPGQLVTEAQLTELLRSVGLKQGDSVVVTYQGKDVTDFGSAARVYWTLKSAGFESVSILNGGIAAWQAAGKELSTDAPAVEPSDISVTFSDRWLATRDDVAAVVDGKRKARLVDARPAAFYEGKTAHPAAARPGTLPQAELFTHSSWFNADDPAIVQPEAAQKLAAEHGYTATDDTLVSFCNTGHWAATNWFALSELAGVENVKLYPESVVGWSNAGLPMENTPGLFQNLWNKVTGSR
jgi:thiosulfate/3-mercaptopyruvate sulfurtransferase